MTRALLLVLLLALPSLAQSHLTLVEALYKMRGVYPAAQVTGRFADYRAPSIYRSHAGLHNGYDIAMPAGSAVPAVWPGTVVAVTPWTDTQVGISVLCSNGYEVTYGHLIGQARVGQVVKPGDVLGLVAVDHVDIKVRDPQGAFYDFGTGTLAVANPAEMALEKARWALQEVNELKSQLATVNDQYSSLKQERSVLGKERNRLARMVPQLTELIGTGAVAPADEARLPLRLHFVEGRLKEIATRLPLVSKQRSRLRDEVILAQAVYEREALEAAGYGKFLKDDEPAVLRSKTGPALVVKGNDRLEVLLKYGVLSKKEYDEARRRQRWDAAASKSAVGGAPGGGSGH